MNDYYIMELITFDYLEVQIYIYHKNTVMKILGRQGEHLIFFVCLHSPLDDILKLFNLVA